MPDSEKIERVIKMQDARCKKQEARGKRQEAGCFFLASCFLLLASLLLTASKPIPPVDIIMKLVKQPEIYGTAVIELQVIPLIAHSNLEVRIEIPEKLKLVGGVEKWSGILEVDKVQTFQYSVYIPDNNIYEIKASVKLKLLTGETVKREETLEINPTGKKKGHKKLPEKKGEGRGVIEFKGE